MNNLVNWLTPKIRCVDIYGAKAKIKIKDNETVKTTFGGLLTIATLVLIALCVLYLINEFLADKYSRIFFSQMNGNSETSLYGLNNSNYTLAFSLQNAYTKQEISDNSIYQAEAFQVIKKKINDTNSFYTIENKLELETCSISSFPDNIRNQLSNFPFQNFYCLKSYSFFNLLGKANYFNLYYNRSEDEYSFLTIKLKECRNKTTNSISNINNYQNNYNNNISNYQNLNDQQIICKPQESIDRELSVAYFTLIYTDIAINPGDYNTQNQIFISSFNGAASNKFFKEIDHFLKLVNLQVNTKNWLFEDQLIQSFIQPADIKEIMDFRLSDSFLSYSVKFSGIIDTYLRSDLKIYNLAANLYACLNILSGIFSSLCYFYSKSKFYEFIGEELMTDKSKSLNESILNESQLRLNSINLKKDSKNCVNSNNDYISTNSNMNSSYVINKSQNLNGKKTIKNNQNNIFNNNSNKLNTNYDSNRSNYFDIEIEKGMKGHNITFDNEKNFIYNNYFDNEKKNSSEESITDSNIFSKNTNSNINNNKIIICEDKNINNKITTNKLNNKNKLVENINSIKNKKLQIQLKKEKADKIICHSFKNREVNINNFNFNNFNFEKFDKFNKVNNSKDINSMINNKNKNKNLDILKSNSFKSSNLVSRNEKQKKQLFVAKRRNDLNLFFCQSYFYILCSCLFRKTKIKNFKKMNFIINKTDEYLNVIKIFKSINDLERIKKLMLDKEQLLLFNLPYYIEIDFNEYAKHNRISFSSFAEHKVPKLPSEVQEYLSCYNSVGGRKDRTSKRLLKVLNYMN